MTNIAEEKRKQYEEILRQVVRREYLRAVEDMEMDRERVLTIMREEIEWLANPREFKPSVMSFIRQE